MSIKNPLRMQDVFSRGLEGVDSISLELVRLGIITREDRLEILEMRPLRKAMARIREAVLAAGHDGIVYENQHEGVIPADKINELPQEYQVEINDAFSKDWVGESKKWVVRKKGDDFPYGMGPTKEIAVKNALKRLNTKGFRRINGRKFDSYIAFHPSQIKSAFSNTGEFSPDFPDIRYRLVPPWLSDGGLPPKILGPMIDAASKGWRYRPDIVVVADQNQLPLGVRMAIPPGNIVKGVCYQGAVFLVRSNLDGYRDALDTLFHEAFGHYGLRLMGEAAKPFLRDLYAAKAPEIKEIAKKYNLDVGKPRDRLAAAEEWAEDEAMIERRVAGYIRTYGENAEFMIRSAVSRGRPLDAELAKIREMFASGRIGASANIYKLDIPDDVIPSLLDWDKPLAEQSESVRIKLEPLLNRLLEKADHEKPESRTLPNVVKRIKDGTATGESIYRWAGRKPEEASRFLASLGIPGCKYADQNSRKIHMALGNNLRWNVSTPKGVFPFDTEQQARAFAEKQRTYNFVIWDQEVLDRVALLERNGKRLDAIRAARDRQGEEERAMFLFGGPKGASPSGAARPADAKRMRNVHGKRVGGRLCPAL